MIKTDQQALKHLLDQKALSPMQQKGFAKLVGLNYDIEYKKGTYNKVADALSRFNSEEVQCAALHTITPTWVQQMLQSYKTDSYLTKVLTSKSVDPTTYPNFQIANGLITFKNRLAIGADANLRASILKEMHGSSYGGHSGIYGTYMRAKGVFYWPQMRVDVEQLVHGCDVCQRTKRDNISYPGLL